MDTLRPKIQLETSQGPIEIQPKNIRFRTNSLMSVKYAMVNGVGIGLLPSPISEPEVEKGTLIPILPNALRGTTTEFYAVYPSREYLAPKVRVLLEWISERFPNH
jgi:DNA-binding transcriptional LysR family regulator